MRAPALVLAAAVALAAAPALAQQVTCIPGTSVCGQVGPDGKIIVAPPPVGVQGQGTVQGQGQGQGQGQVQVAPPSWQEQVAKWRLQWDAYFRWRAQLKVQVDIDVAARLHAEAHAADLAVPDPYLHRPLSIPGPSVPDVHFPRMSLGLLGFCFGHWVGEGAPVYAGYCPSIRYRLGRLAIALDPSLTDVDEANRQYVLFAVRPDVTYAILAGSGETLGSELFVRGGGDVYFPFDTDYETPAAFLGAHAGIGAQITGATWAFGMDWRATLRGGVSPGTDPASRAMADFRAGTEVRAYVTVEF